MLGECATIAQWILHQYEEVEQEATGKEQLYWCSQV